MKLTDKNKAFYHAVYTAVSKVPYGHATSYGHIATLVGRSQNSRQVGSALKNLNIIIPALLLDLADGEANYALDTIPWWRVVSSSGKILPRENTVGEIDQVKCLYAEGMLPDCKLTIVDLRRFGWFPDEGDVDVYE